VRGDSEVVRVAMEIKKWMDRINNDTKIADLSKAVGQG